MITPVWKLRGVESGGERTWDRTQRVQRGNRREARRSGKSGGGGKGGAKQKKRTRVKRKGAGSRKAPCRHLRTRALASSTARDGGRGPGMTLGRTSKWKMEQYRGKGSTVLREGVYLDLSQPRGLVSPHDRKTRNDRKKRNSPNSEAQAPPARLQHRPRRHADGSSSTT